MFSVASAISLPPGCSIFFSSTFVIYSLLCICLFRVWILLLKKTQITLILHLFLNHVVAMK